MKWGPPVSREFTLHDALEAAISATMENVHTALPGRIKEYAGHETRLAVVQPSVRLPMLAGPQLDVPHIHGVPVVFPSTKSGSLLFPVEPGDGVLLIFSEVGFGNFMKSSENDVTDSDSMRRHSLADAIAIPGMFSTATIPPFPKGADQTKTLLTNVGGAYVELGDKVRLKNGASDLYTELDKLWAALIALRQDIASQFGNIATGVGQDATFLGNTVTACTSSSNEQTAAVPGLVASRLALLEFLK